MPTKFLPIQIDDDSKLSHNRWAAALNSLSALVASNNNVTRDMLLLVMSQALTDYLKHVESYIGDFNDVAPNYAPDLDAHNREIVKLQFNLNLLYSELISLHNVAQASYNRISTEKQDLFSRIARVGAKVRTLGLYNIERPIGSYIGESFYSLDNIAIGATDVAPLLSVDTDSGVVTLPINDSNKLDIINIAVDENISNGSVGNKYDAGVAFDYDKLASLIDGEPNTWWEYELVRNNIDNTLELKLDLVATLKGVQLCNKVSITPMNLGTVSEVMIDSIEGSTDGSLWFSLANDMPLATYLAESTDDILKVQSPLDARTKSVSVYFAPRYVQYIRFKLSISESVLIRDNTDEDNVLYRYAIALRDVSIYRNSYSSYGGLLSKPYDTRHPFNTMLMVVAMTDPNSQLYGPSFSIGMDNGDLFPIQPVSASGLDAEEVINLLDKGASPSSIRFKLEFTRNDDVFNELDIASLTDEKNVMAETFNREYGVTPIAYGLSNKPVDNTVIVMEDLIYSVGRRFKLATNTGSFESGVNAVASLPFSILPGDTGGSLSFDDVQILINNTAWTRANSLSNVSADAKAFEFINDDDSPYTKVKWGDSGGTDAYRKRPLTSGGKMLPSGSVVEALIQPEELVFEYDSNNYNAMFRQPYNGNISATVIEGQTSKMDALQDVIPFGSRAYQLRPYISDSDAIIIVQKNEAGATLSLATYVTLVEPFVDGDSELTDAGEYSIDLYNGVIYSYDECPADRTTLISYSYFNREVLDESQFSVMSATDGQYIKYVGISIPEQHFRTFSISEQLDSTRSASSSFNPSAPTTPRYFSNKTNLYSITERAVYLSNGGIVKGTLALPDNLLNSDSPPYKPLKEIDYVDGVREFITGGNVITTDIRYYSVDYLHGAVYFAEPLGTPTGEITYQCAVYRATYDVANYLTDYNVNGTSLDINGDAVSGLGGGNYRICYEYNLDTGANSSDITKYYTPILRDVQIRYV